MRVAMVSEHASPLAAVGGVDAGGQNVHVAALATAVARLGAEVIVHTRRDDTELPRRVMMAPGVIVDHVPAGPPVPVPKDELLVHMPAFARQLRRQWRSHTPDIVHAHFWMSGMASIEAARPLGIPVAQTFHALGVVKKRHQGRADTSPRRRLRIEQRLIEQVDRIIATCRDEVEELAALGANLAKACIVPCGVDTEHFTVDGPREPVTPGVRRLVAVGRLVQRKGIDDVITALAQLPGTELIVAGGPAAADLARDPEAQRLTAHATATGVADRVHLRGRVDRDAVPALLRSADVVVCAPWYEPFGIVPLEAMACGVPVVGTDVGGLRDTIVHGVTGLRVPPRCPDELAAAIRSVLDDPLRANRYAAAGAARARASYQWSRIAEETLKAYEATLASTGALEGMAL